VNPYFDADFPNYIIGLRSAPDETLPLIEFDTQQRMTTGGTDLTFSGVDAENGFLALALPQTAPISSVDSSGLVGGSGSMTTIPAGSLQLYSSANGGTFQVLGPAGGSYISTVALPFNATSNQIRQAINEIGALGVVVSTVYGAGTVDDPWTLVGTGLDSLQIDDTGLAGSGILGRLTLEELKAVSTTATSGTFTLTIDIAGTPHTTAPLSLTATTDTIRAAIDAVGGVLAGKVTGLGTAEHPWILGPRVQSIKTGDAIVFHDAWGQSSSGLLDGQTYFAIVAPEAGQGKTGSVVIQLAATHAGAIATIPVTVPLTTTTDFDEPVMGFMAGGRHGFTSPLSSSSNGIKLSATVKSTDSIGNKSANGGEPKFRDVLTRGDFASVKNLRDTWKNIFSKGLKKDDDSPLGKAIGDLAKVNGDDIKNSGWTVSGAFGVLIVKNEARVVVGPTAVLRTPGAVEISTDIKETLKSSVEGTVSKPYGSSKAFAVAVDVVLVSNTSHAIVESGAKITGGSGVKVDSQVIYPWAGQMYIDRYSDTSTLWKTIPANLLKHLTDAINGKLGIDEWLINHWVNVGIKQKAPNSDTQIKLSAAGSGSGINLSNDCLAQIEDGAEINQDPTVQSTPDQSLSVTAKTSISQTLFAGTIYLDFSPDGIGKTYRKFGKTKFLSGVPSQLLVQQQGKNAIGASVGVVKMETRTRALLGGVSADDRGSRPPRPANPGKLLVNVGQNGLTVNASTNNLIIQVGQAGGQASNNGFSGTAAAIDSNQITEASIQGGDASHKAVIRSNPGTSGKIQVNAADTSYLIPVAGAALIGASKGAGVSVAIGMLSRDVTARIGMRDENAPLTLIDMVGMGDVAVGSSADGAVTPTAGAGSIRGSSTNPYAKENAGPNYDIEENGITLDKWGLGISGAGAAVDIADSVVATINHGGSMIAAAPGTSISLNAANTTTILANSGSLSARSSTETVSVGLAGAVSWIVAASDVEATIRRATISGYSLAVEATNDRSIGTVAVSAAGGGVGGDGGFTLNAAVSVGGLSLTTKTIASIDRVNGTSLSGTRVIATTKDLIWNIAGSFVANVSSILTRYKYDDLFEMQQSVGAENGRSLAAGVSVAIVTAKPTTKATVVSSKLVLAQGNMSVGATDSSTVITVSAGGSLVSTKDSSNTMSVNQAAGSTVAGMVAIVNIDPTVEASITDSTIELGTTGGDLSVLSTTALLLATASGAVVINRDGRSSASASVGAAVTVVNTTSRGTAKIDEKSKVTVPRGKVRVRSTNGNPDDAEWTALDPVFSEMNMPEAGTGAVWSFAVAAMASDSSFSAAASVTVTNVTNFQTATIGGE